ncbi:biotin--[acetyl-CoA-carboxylase] ligase [Candidatus Cytomitobacter indipagum]|uniref:biotin--[biotin carboxyl-carrier protein] ligase n=1 Tax=Candidatus Cytomitobacter indipagum TaxID=2601575 RepID=A0A5C0UCZ6_9PROT|nr:biotin--[acetyl-CoA-carboxylase] ligase [Candidatus Cytomitobacter indipagum]QEK37895.1 biotin--[acetyl-CoA-carboxylase] ligase [Candidatus Cytomitobacter indipagum]
MNLISLSNFKKFLLINLDQIDSTQIIAKDIIHEKYNEEINLESILNENKFIAIKAKKQNDGRGQYGRSWHSPEGNLYLSCIVKLKKCNVINLTQIFTILIHDILQNYNVEISVKWINDILYNNKKMGGVICDLHKYKEHQLAVIGIGINVNIAHAENSICLKDILKHEIDIEKLTEDICDEILTYLDNFLNHGINFFLKKLNKYSAYLNQEITLHIENQEIEGIFKGYDKNGMIIIESNNERRTFHKGRLRLKDNLSYKL